MGIRAAALMAAVLSLAGCATESADIRFKAYKDGSVDPSQVATITATAPANGDTLYFEDVDDQSTPYPASNLVKAFGGVRHYAGIIDMAPGKHVFTIGYRTKESEGPVHYTRVELSLVAAAGEKYTLESQRQGPFYDAVVDVWIIDGSGNKIVESAGAVYRSH